MAVKENIRAVFLDKDGTLVHDVRYNVNPALVTFYSDVVPSLHRLQKAGYRLFIISNQSGVARGFFDEQDVQKVLAYIVQQLEQEGLRIHDALYCPHHPEGTLAQYAISCMCRKPQPGLLWTAAARHGISLQDSWMIGDILDDVEAGNRANCRSVLLDNGNETIWKKGAHRKFVFKAHTLSDAAERILQEAV